MLQLVIYALFLLLLLLLLLFFFFFFNYFRVLLGTVLSLQPQRSVAQGETKEEKVRLCVGYMLLHILTMLV